MKAKKSKPKTIKLSKEVMTGFQQCNNLRSSLQKSLTNLDQQERALWEALRKEYPEYGFVGAYINHETNNLIFPYPNIKDNKVSQ